jgi:SNF2 family DNA or RNA helicase
MSAYASSYHTDWGGLLPFQQEVLVRFCESQRRRLIAKWDQGLGKSELTIATGAYLIENDIVDQIIVVCEKNKLSEWVEDFPAHSSLTARHYRGTTKQRAKIRSEELGAKTNVLVTTYETWRTDLVHVPAGTKAHRLRGRMKAKDLWFDTLPRRLLVAFDEVSKLRNRGSLLHATMDLWLDTLTEAHPPWVLGLTGTPVEKSPEDLYNLLRIFARDLAGTVEDFETTFVAKWDLYNRPISFKHLDVLANRAAPVIAAKSKLDPDVIDQFPKKVEEVTSVPLYDTQDDFYRVLLDKLDPADDGAWMLLRLVIAHPMAILASKSPLSQMVAETVGEEGLARMGSAKTDRLVEFVHSLAVEQRQQVVVFTFFGQSVLPLLREALERAEIRVSVNHGQMSDAARDESKRRFRSGETQVFLSSDSGRRGINLPEASYLIHYELPLLYSDYSQRSDRIHRIDSKHPSITIQTFLAANTIEEDLADRFLKREKWGRETDATSEDNDAAALTAAERRQIIEQAKRHPPPKREKHR